jgi:hypothetical protein
MENPELLAYPNPTRHSLTVEGPANHLSQLNILNKYGQDASKSVRITRSGSDKLTIDVSELSSGVYYVKTPTYLIKLSKLQ